MNRCRLRRFSLALFTAFSVTTLPVAALSDTATWIGGAGNWTDATKWSSGTVPNDVDGAMTDVVIDGDGDSASSATLSSADSATFSVWSILIDAGDTLTVNKAKHSSTGRSLRLYASSITNCGTFVQSNGASKNDGTCYITSSNAFFNAAGSLYKLAGYGSYKGCHTGLTIPAEGSENNGDMLVQQPLSQSNSSSLTLTGVGRFVNNGTITLKATGSSGTGSAYLRCNYANAPGAGAILDGTGEIVLDQEDAATVGQYVRMEGVKYNDTNRSTFTITNGPSHTIRGTGSIRECALVNAGLVRAEGTNGVLTVENSSIKYGGKPICNLSTGRMVACTGAGLEIGATGTDNARFTNEGLLEARAGGSILFRQSLTTSANKSTNTASTPLDLSGTVAGAGTLGGKPLCLLADATLSPGDLSNADGTGVSTTGTLTVTTNLVLSAGTTLDFQFGLCEEGGYDTVAVEGSLALAGTLRVSALDGIRPSGIYRIFTCNPGELTGDRTSVVLDVQQGVHAPLVLVNAPEGTVDVYFPPLETIVILR